MEQEGYKFILLETAEVGAFFSNGHGLRCGYFAGDVGFFLANEFAFETEPFFFFELDDGGGDGPIVAELVPGRVASVAEDDLVGVWGMASAAIYADSCLAGFSAFFGTLGGGWLGKGGRRVV